MFPLLGYSLLATLPTALLSEWMGWDFMEPKGYFAEIAWTPVLVWCQLKALAALHGRPRQLGRVEVITAFSAEALIGLRLAGVGILSFLPALIWSAYAGWESPFSRLTALALAGLGAVPPTLYLLRRLFYLPVILWQGLGASAAREESARLSRGKLMKVLPILLGGQLAAGILTLAGEFGLVLGLIVLPSSFLLGLWALAISYKKLL